MSRRSVQKFTAAPPKPPPATQAGDEVSRFHGGVVAWMGQMALAYNRNIENTQRDRASTATVIPFYDSSGVPNVVYYCINAFLHDDGLLHAVEKQKSAWALRFDLTGDLFEVLYCAALTDPIVWTSYLSVGSSGTAVVIGYVPVTRTVNGHALSANVTVTKGDVGLGNADDTSDANKPVSTATQTALNLKAPIASPTLTGTPAAPTAGGGTNTTQIATTAFVRQELSSGVATAVPAYAAVSFPYTTKTADYSLTATDHYITVDATGGNVTVTLPTAAGISGRCYGIKRLDNVLLNTVTVATTGGQTVDGAGSLGIIAQYEAHMLVSDGANWWIF